MLITIVCLSLGIFVEDASCPCNSLFVAAEFKLLHVDLFSPAQPMQVVILCIEYWACSLLRAMKTVTGVNCQHETTRRARTVKRIKAMFS